MKAESCVGESREAARRVAAETHLRGSTDAEHNARVKGRAFKPITTAARAAAAGRELAWQTGVATQHAYKHRLRALAEEKKRAKKAAEAAEAVAVVMPSAAAVAEEVSAVVTRLIWELEIEEGYAEIASW